MSNKICQKGDKVKVHYTGSLTNGQIFDSSKERAPLEIQVGEGQLIKGFEDALIGMCEGESKKIEISPNEAYGEHNPQLVRPIERKFLPQNMEPQVGMQLQIGENEDMTIVTITEVTDDSVTLDANHPLAGKQLNFELELVEIVGK